MEHQTEADTERNELMTKIVNNLLKPTQTYDESQRLYSQWANAGSYDNMLDSHQEHYAGPFAVTKHLSQLVTDTDKALVLDLGCGTGIITQMMMEKGFKHFHGLDPCKEFIEISKTKGIYQNLMEQFIGGGSVVDAPDNTYDAIVTVGTFCPGHIPCDSLHEIIRILKPGGYFFNGMREEFLSIVPEYKDRLEPLMNQLVEEGKWKKIVWDKYDNHFNEKDGIVMVFQKC